MAQSGKQCSSTYRSATVAGLCVQVWELRDDQQFVCLPHHPCDTLGRKGNQRLFPRNVSRFQSLEWSRDPIHCDDSRHTQSQLVGEHHHRASSDCLWASRLGRSCDNSNRIRSKAFESDPQTLFHRYGNARSRNSKLWKLLFGLVGRKVDVIFQASKVASNHS